MADGQIKIEIDVDGKKVNTASKELDQLGKQGTISGKGIKDAEDGLKGVSNESGKASSGIKNFVSAVGLVAIASAAFKTLKASLDEAINRFDTLNKFPKVLQALGVSAEDSERAVNRLADGIDGLPTTLNDISANAQNMYSAFNDMDKATDMALALNNALLGSGSSAAEAQRGVDMYMKILNTGKVDMMTWNSLNSTMGVGLTKLAEEFGYTGASAKNDLYKALQDGIVPMNDFHDKLIEIGTGTGIMATLAKENSKGIATSIGNLKNTAARGIASIITSFNELSKEVTNKDIAEHIDSLKHIVNAAFKIIGSAIEGTTPVIKMFASGVQSTLPVVNALTPAIIGLMSAYGAYIVITKVNSAIQASNAILKIAIASKNGLTLATNAKVAAEARELAISNVLTVAKAKGVAMTRAQAAAIASETLATKAQTLATAAQTGAVRLSTIAIGIMTGSLSVSAGVKIIAAAAANALGVAWRFMLGPIGWIIAGIGLLVTGVIAVVKWFKRTTAEANRLNAETEDLGETTDALNESIKSSATAYEENQKSSKATAETNRELAKGIEDLIDKENKSAAEKMLLKDRIEQLNGSVEGLNLAYNEESDALSMSSDELRIRIGLLEEETSYNDALERQAEIIKERNEAEAKLDEINALREEWNQKLEEGTIKSSEHKDAIAELDEQEQLLKETLSLLAEQYGMTEEQITASLEAITEATQNGVNSQIIEYEKLSEANQALVDDMISTWQDYEDAATDMFDTLSDEITVTASEMQSNMEENQRVISEWADNIALLAERGVDEGLLDKLREAGPESAGHVNALVKASDDELEKLSEVFRSGTETATDAMASAFDIDDTGIPEAIANLASNTEQTLADSLRNANFEEVGFNIPEGVAIGIKDGTPEVADATRNMGKEGVDAIEGELGIQSPSTVFKGIGLNTTEGIVLGVNEGTTKVIDTMKRLAVDSVLQFKNFKSDFTKIGSDAMAGLNSGLNAGSSQVMATARRIANSVNATMKKALDIHSPSRKARDEVGKEYTAGIALGIKDNARLAYDAINRLADGMITIPDVEVALGATRMAYVDVGSRNTNVVSSGNKSNTEPKREEEKYIMVQMNVDGRPFAKAIAKPLSDIYNQQEIQSIRAIGGYV